MKRFACGDVVPGCKATFQGESTEDVLMQVAEHARADHQMDSVPAEVVYYNPDIDIAVLALDSGDAPILKIDRTAEAQDGVAILGYPQDGPYHVEPGRIRAEQRLRSPNIYGSGAVIREVYSLRGRILPGNSGGPIVSSAGDAVGVVFAASVTDPDTGYALTATQVSSSAASGLSSSSEVSTGDCAG